MEMGSFASTQSGKSLPDDEIKKLKVTIKDGRMAIDGGGRQEVVAVTVDSTMKPKGIHLRPLKLNDGQMVMGIFELDGDNLKLCWGGEKQPGGRPEEFKTTKEGGGRLLVLK
jgi:uncharacterized protein (TIGR03067 family)